MKSETKKQSASRDGSQSPAAETVDLAPAADASAVRLSDLGLSEPLVRSVEELGYERATPIQAAAIPVVLAGRDLVGCAQTGTGKTAAFTLPTLDRLLATRPKSTPDGADTTADPTPPADDSRQRGTGQKGRGGKGRGGKGSRPKPRVLRALVLAPTRELAAQIGESFARYGQHTPSRTAVIFGGVPQGRQVDAMRHGVDVLVATPGRLLDLMGQGHVRLGGVEVLILDEADQMLDMGFLPDLKRIVSSVPKERQTLLFSATMPPEIRRLADQWLDRPESIQVAPVATPAERIAQSVHFVDKKRKPDLLVHLLKSIDRGRTLVFSRTKHGADKIARKLEKKGIDAAAIHGNKSQGARNRALREFKGRRPPVLVATDIAARGLDISGVSHVVNFDLPETPETYVHRIGRTARAGAEGASISFCAGDERGLLKQIERLTKRSVSVEPTVEGFEPVDPITVPEKPGRRGGRGNQRGGNAGGKPPRGKRAAGKPTAKPAGAGRRSEKPKAHGETTTPPSGKRPVRKASKPKVNEAKAGQASGSPSQGGKPRTSKPSATHPASAKPQAEGAAKPARPRRRKSVVKGSTAPIGKTHGDEQDKTVQAATARRKSRGGVRRRRAL